MNLKYNIMKSNTWTTARDISNISEINTNLTCRIYRDNTTGFEAFIISENENTYLIKGNDIKCRIHKKTTKNKIKNVSPDYKLRKFII